MMRFGMMGSTRRRGSASPFASMTPGTWANYTTNLVTSAGINPDPAVSSGSPFSAGQYATAANCKGDSGVSGLINAWGGGVYYNGKVYFFGGGHTDYVGNHLIAWNVATQLFEFVEWPEYGPFDDTGITGSGKPVARHVYGAIAQYNGMLYVSGSYGNYSAAAPGLHWRRSLPTGTWVQRTSPTTHATDSSHHQLNWDTTHNLLFSLGQYSLQSYSTANDTPTLRRDMTFDPGYAWDGATSAIDVANRKLVVIGRASSAAHITEFDIATLSSNMSASFNVTYTGDGVTAATASNNPGVLYDTQRSRVVVWSGGANVLNVNTSSRTITTVTPHVSNAVTPGANPGSGVGTGKRFIYLPPPYDVYLLARTAADGIQIYKPID